MARQWFAEGTQFCEEGELEFFAEGTQFNEVLASPPLVAGTIAFVSSGPGGITIDETVAASGGTGAITRQWQRSDDGGAYGDLVGETGDPLADDTATDEGVAYRYRAHYTDEGAGDEFSNVIGPIFVYTGGVIGGGGGGSIFDSAVIR